LLRNLQEIPRSYWEAESRTPASRATNAYSLVHMAHQFVGAEKYLYMIYEVCRFFFKKKLL
jgi:hypothetical protein